MDKIEHWIDAFLVNSGVSDEFAMYIRLLILLVVLFLVSATAFLITKQIVIRLIYKFVRKSTVKWDDLLAEKRDRKSTRLNSSHVAISYAVFCLKKKIQ